MYLVSGCKYVYFCKFGHFNISLSGDWLTFGATLKWPFEELQFLALAVGFVFEPWMLLPGLCWFKLIYCLMWLLHHSLRCCFWCRTWMPCCEGHAEVNEGMTALPTTAMTTTAMTTAIYQWDCLNNVESKGTYQTHNIVSYFENCSIVCQCFSSQWLKVFLWFVFVFIYSKAAAHKKKALSAKLKAFSHTINIHTRECVC